MAKGPSNRSSGYGKYTPEELANLKLSDEARKAVEEALAEEAKTAKEAKAAAVEKRKEAKAVRDAEKQSIKQVIDSIKQETASNKKGAGSKGSGAALQTTGPLGASAAGVAGTVGSAIKEQTIGSAFSIKGIAAAMNESLGLKGLGLALGSIVRDKKGPGKAETLQATQVEVLTGILAVTEVNKEILLNILDAIKGKGAQNIEAQREAAAIPGALEQKGEGGKGGAGGGILSSIGGFSTKMLQPILGMFKNLGSIFTGLAAFAAQAAIPIAILVGIVASLEKQDWVKIFTNLSKIFDDLIKGDYLTAILRTFGTIQDFLITGIGRLFANILEFFGFDRAAKYIRDYLDKTNFADMIVESIQPIIGAFAYLRELALAVGPKIASVFSKIGEFFKPIMGVVETIGELFSTVFGGLSKFGSIFGTVAKIVGKLALPLTIVMSVWDTVKGAMEGYEQDGIVGAISGAIKGLFNSLIFGPLDMIKDAAAWVLGFFGFDKAKEILNSFSFEKMFSSFVDGFIDTVKYVKDYVTEAVPKMIDSFKEWWDGFNLVDTILGGFNWLKDKVMSLFSGDTLSKAMDDVLSFNPVGFIAEKIGNFANGIAKFFADLPSNIVDALPDGMVKNTLKKFIGPSEQGTPTASSQGTQAVPQTPYVSPGTEYDMITGMPLVPGLAPVTNSSATAAIQSSNDNAVTSASGALNPVIINNNVSNSGGGSSATPRVSGAVSTAPVGSHLDRSLYGDYGAGYP